MAYPVFPSLAGLGWPVVRTRTGKTLVQEATSGKETRVQLWTYPRYKWSLQFDVLRTDAALAEFQTLMGFVNQVAGQAQPFLYTDPDDQQVTAQNIGTGDGATTQFQLVRILGGFTEPVQAIGPGNGTLSVNGSALTYGTSAGQWHWNNDFGLGGTLTIVTAPAAGAAITWTGSYYWLCRLLSDDAAFSADMQGFYSLKKLEFQQVKL